MTIKEDYSKYSYSRVLDFLQDAYLCNSDNINYAKYLLNMNEQSTIEALIKIYDKVMRALPDFVYGKNYVPDYWYFYELWPGPKVNLHEDIHNCLNVNILRIYLAQENPSDEFAYKCLANLRLGPNTDEIHRTIISTQGSLDSLVVEQISNTRKGVNDIRHESFNYGAGSNGMKLLEEKYVNCRKYLSQYGYIASIIEKTFEYKKGVYYAESSEDKRNKIIGLIIVIIVLALLLVLIMYIADNLLGIILFVGACFALPKLIKG